MRKDVKIGVLLSLVLVVAAGWYFLRRSSQDEVTPLTVELASSNAQQGQAEPAAPAEPQVIRRQSSPRPSRQTQQQPTHAARRRQAPATRRDVDTPQEENSPDLGDLFAFGPQVESDDDTASPASVEDLLRTGQDTTGTTEQPEPQPAAAEVATTESDETPPAVEEEEPAAPPVTARRPNPRTASHTPRQPQPSTPQRTHTVERGDTLAILAEVYYGSQRYTGLILGANPQVTDPNRLLVGTVLHIPPLDAPSPSPSQPSSGSATPSASPTNTYTVKDGDTFYGIARDMLGAAARWTELFELNKDLVDGDPTKLRPGQVIKLPPKATG